MREQPRPKIDELITIENVQTKGNRVVYDYSLSESWLMLSADRQREKQANTNKDLIYRTCSLEAAHLAQAEGLEEEHNYYDQYPDKVTFILRASAQTCMRNGFTQQPQSQCLMRCAYQAYDLHVTVDRIRCQYVDLPAERFYTIAATHYA